MQKILLFIITMGFLLLLISCKEKTYDDIYESYESYISSQNEKYDHLIETYNFFQLI